MTRFLLAALVATMVHAADSPRVVYTKIFPGSTPAYVGITVERGGAASYKETPDDDPETFQLENHATSAIFDLAGKLDHFKHPLESGLKVANLGSKTFRWEDGSAASEVKFNYSLDQNARALEDWFERITESERAFVQLRLVVKHDKLGVDDALLRIQSLWDQKRLVGTEQFLPLFDRIVHDETYINMARERAAALAQAVRASSQAKAE